MSRFDEIKAKYKKKFEEAVKGVEPVSPQKETRNSIYIKELRDILFLRHTTLHTYSADFIIIFSKFFENIYLAKLSL